MDNGNSDETERRNYALSGKIMLISVIIIFVVIITMLCLHLQIRWYLLHARRRRSQFFFYVDPSVSTAATRGLDASVISSLPVFTFSPKTHPDPVECAVCLSELEDGETGRILPKCNHAFHVGCIDMWFHSHSTCPLCRVLVEPAPDPEARPGVTDLNPGSSSGLCSECEQGVSVSVELPGRNESFRGESSSSSSFRSPMSRVLSLTRILSREKKASVSPVSGCEAGCSSMTMTELDAERGHESVVTRSTGV